jgi:hypothetical protein
MFTEWTVGLTDGRVVELWRSIAVHERRLSCMFLYYEKAIEWEFLIENNALKM